MRRPSEIAFPKPVALAVAAVLAGVVACSLAAATPVFTARTAYPTGASPAAAAVGDLNGDSVPDCAWVNYGPASNSVSVALGAGGGTLGPRTDYATGVNPVAVAIGDLNHDGHPDLVVSNWSGASVSVFLGTGGGAFAAATNYATGTSRPISGQLVDVNGDGHLDLIAAGWSSHVLVRLLGTGTGSFGTPTTYPAGNQPYGLALGDLNGDGRVDAVATNRSTTNVSVMLGLVGGGFGAPTAVTVGSDPISAALADVNGDGNLDALVTNYTSNTVSVLPGNGLGGFGARVDYATGAQPFSVGVADFDLDGLPDLAVSDYADNDLAIFAGIGGGSFAPRVNLATAAGPSRMAVADLNADGRSDLVVPCAVAESLAVHKAIATCSGLSVTASLTSGLLSVAGTACDDDVRLSLAPGGATLQIDDRANGTGVDFTFPFASVTSVQIALGDGADEVICDDTNGSIALQRPTSIDVGSGDNVVVSTTGSLTPAQVTGIDATIGSLRTTLAGVTTLRSMADQLRDDAAHRAVQGEALRQSAANLLIEAQAMLAQAKLDSAAFETDLLPFSIQLESQRDAMANLAAAFQQQVLDFTDTTCAGLPAARRPSLLPTLDCAARLFLAGVLADTTGMESDSTDADSLADEQLDAQVDAFTAFADSFATDAESQWGAQEANFNLLAANAEAMGDSYFARVLAQEAAGEALDQAANVALQAEADAFESDMDLLEAAGDALEAAADVLVAQILGLIDGILDDSAPSPLARAQAAGATCDPNTDLLLFGAGILIGTPLNDYLIGSPSTDFMFGGGGDDKLEGEAGIDFLFGGRGNDDLRGGPGYDVILGWKGDDCMDGGADPDLLIGGVGDDLLDGYRDQPVASCFHVHIPVIEVDFEFGDFLWGGQGSDTIHGSDCIDLVFGRAGADDIAGNDGMDFIFGSTENDVVASGAGGGFKISGSDVSPPLGDFVFGGTGDDVLSGGDHIDLIFGRAGKDRINGGGQFDLAFGGVDADTLHGDGGSDLLFGGPEPDVVHGDDDPDLAFGGADQDSVCGDGRIDVLFGNAAVDQLDGGEGLDLLFGNGDADALHGADGVDFAFGGPGDDQIHGDSSFDVLFGGAGIDHVYGDDFADVLFGGLEDDAMFGGIGIDFVFGNDGKDELHGESGIDLMFGGPDDDELYGDTDPDLLAGGAGFDWVYGGIGIDVLLGNANNDHLYGEEDLDLLLGNSGNDRMWGGLAGDVLLGGDDYDTIYGEDGIDLILGNADNDFAEGGPVTDLVIGSAGEDVLSGGTGIDLMFGGADADCVHGDESGDVVFGNGAFDRLYGDAGYDLLFGGDEHDCVDGGEDTDAVFGNSGDDEIHGSTGGDYLFGNQDNDTINGDNQDDYLFGGKGGDALFGGDGRDILFGNKDNDNLQGGEGWDWCFGGKGDDTIDGEGADHGASVACAACNSSTGQLAGAKFNDKNSSGTWDAGEPGIGGWQIQYTGPATGSVMTGANGSYVIPGLPAGVYTVCEETRPAWTQTTPGGCYTIKIGMGEAVSGLNFGNTTCGNVAGGVRGIDWLHDAFPFIELPGLVGTTAFDTTTAFIVTGRNIAQATGTAMRFDVPGDTLVACACGDSVRVDLVFRILPGPGNYQVSAGRTYPLTNSMQLLRLPTNQGSIVTPGDPSFWGQYLADNGLFGTPGGHPAGRWSENVWNSARIDTAQRNLFPVDRLGDLQEIGCCLWMGTYHEADPKYGTLGINKFQCYVVDTLYPATSSPIRNNVVCNGTAPAWLSALPHSYSGWNGSTVTKEGTKIIPDGLLTPGSHVQYFLRRSNVADPVTFTMVPDTNVVTPQPNEVASVADACTPNPLGSTDGHRWQHLGVLPDRWKSPSFGGPGMAVMLYVDLANGHGDQREWVRVAEQLGATAPSKWGAHNGWHSPTMTADPNDPANFVRAHRGQAGTTWDLYRVQLADDVVNGHAGSLGSRLANRSAMGFAAGKSARIGPTAEMLRTYYRAVFVTTADQGSGRLGPLPDRSQNDIAMLDDYLTGAIGTPRPRALHVMGSNFVEGESATGDPAHLGFLSSRLGLSLRNGSYRTWNTAAHPDLVEAGPPSGVFGVSNGPGASLDVLQATGGAGVSPYAYYQAVGAGAPYVASVLHASTPGESWLTLVHGFGLQDVESRYGVNVHGRRNFLYDVFAGVLGPLGTFYSNPLAVDAPAVPLENALQIRTNPAPLGRAVVRLSVVKDEPGEVAVFDAAGRRTRVLANGTLRAGIHDLAWDGGDESGRRMPAGVYFVRVKLASSGFGQSKVLVLLK